jgi:hypothetical protein
MVNEEARQIEQPRHPGDDRDDVEGLDVEEKHVAKELSGPVIARLDRAIQELPRREMIQARDYWIPAFAGMTPDGGQSIQQISA